ncbi:alkaline phosphatase family protein [Candidatus Woesearchaeota archaeon]|nr:alkaline phosphatase family protein [Candidatus Woesearchaeota archaeon]MBW3005636.1 alkaline phosphatase family protein [Candidatus Woesearchaeota archaeon]
MGRIVIIGLDGVPFGLMDDLANRGIMPNFANLREKGTFKAMESAIPEISSVSWSSIITGVNPGEHGIFGFMDLIPGTYTLSFPNFNTIKAPTFWQKDNNKHVILNVPSTYPAKPMNGFHVAGFVALDLENAVYPKEYIPKLEELNYRIDVDSEKGHQSKELFMKDLFRTLEARHITAKHLWDDMDWQTFMYVITGTDRIGHFLWDAYENKEHEFHKQFLDYFKRIDEMIGEISNKMSDDDSLIMISDHGMGLTESNVYVNAVLREHNFLELEDADRINHNHMKASTKAFALDPGRIYLNKEGKYPKGTVKKEDEEKILQELTNVFQNLEKDGKKVIKKIFRKEDVYSGPYLDDAPDLILMANKGFNLRGTLAKKELFGTDIFTGMHTQDDAFLFVKTPKSIKIPENPCVIDVVKIMNEIKGDK